MATARPYRGIANPVGTSCHTSSALQVLFHCFPALTDALLTLAPVSASRSASAATGSGSARIDEEFVHQLAWFYHLLAHGEDLLGLARGGASERSNDAAAASSAAEMAGPLASSAAGDGGDRALSPETPGAGDGGEGPIAQSSAEPARVAAVAAAEKDEPLSPDDSWAQPGVRGSDPDDATSDAGSRAPSLASLPSPGAASERRSRREKTRRNNKLITRRSDCDELQRAAVVSFMRKAREGSSRKSDWEALVAAMKRDRENSNREEYSEQLGGVLRKRDSEEQEHGDEGKAGIMGGKAKPATEVKSDDVGDGAIGPVDPTPFYEHVSRYTADSTGDKKSSIYIDTNNVGDAATAFRCLVSALESSVGLEVARLGDSEDTAAPEGGKVDGDPLLPALIAVRSAIRDEMSGTLLSRIVGTHTTSLTTTAVQNAFEESLRSGSPTTPLDLSGHGAGGDRSSDPRRTVTTVTTVRRTKRDGVIERPLPVPLPVPVARQRPAGSMTPSKKSRDGTSQTYFTNLDGALRSITVEPAPIRGYDWTSLIRRGDGSVVETSEVIRLDEDGNELPSPTPSSPDGSLHSSKDIVGDGETAPTAARTMSAASLYDEDASVTSSTSRTVGCQADFGHEISTQTDR